MEINNLRLLDNSTIEGWARIMCYVAIRKCSGTTKNENCIIHYLAGFEVYTR